MKYVKCIQFLSMSHYWPLCLKQWHQPKRPTLVQCPNIWVLNLAIPWTTNWRESMVDCVYMIILGDFCLLLVYTEEWQEMEKIGEKGTDIWQRSRAGLEPITIRAIPPAEPTGCSRPVGCINTSSVDSAACYTATCTVSLPLSQGLSSVGFVT